jgi:hypothetical protein
VGEHDDNAGQRSHGSSSNGDQWIATGHESSCKSGTKPAAGGRVVQPEVQHPQRPGRRTGEWTQGARPIRTARASLRLPSDK